MDWRVHLDEPAWWYRTPPDAIATCLVPVAAAYGWVAATRYSSTRPYRARLPVICAGNFTAGGTGKTPLVLHLCHHLRNVRRQPITLTRGYGGRLAGPHWVSATDAAADIGDEALLHASAGPTLVSRSRAEGARTAEGRAGPADVLVMDDGLQNASLAKDLSIAMVDGSRGLGNGLVIPAGPLRAPLDFQLGLADAIIVNGNDDAEPVAEWLRHRFQGPVLRSITVADGDAGWLAGQRVTAWAGIASPQRFFDMLDALGAEIVDRITFRDHQRLTDADAERLLDSAARHEATLVSTEKDLARLKGAAGKLAELAAATWTLKIRLSFAERDAERLTALIDSTLKRHDAGHAAAG
jgi:tetraacyldisaccharide 4'-kinase